MSELQISRIAKWALIVLLAAVLIMQAAGNRASSTPFDGMSAAVRQNADLSPMAEGDNQMLKRLYGLDGAREHADALRDEAERSLAPLGDRAAFFYDLLRSLRGRRA